MNFFEQCAQRYEKAQIFFEDPMVSSGRRAQKQDEFNFLKRICTAAQTLYFSEKIGLKYCLDDKNIFIENGVVLETQDFNSLNPDISARELKQIVLIGSVFGRIRVMPINQDPNDLIPPF